MRTLFLAWLTGAIAACSSSHSGPAPLHDSGSGPLPDSGPAPLRDGSADVTVGRPDASLCHLGAADADADAGSFDASAPPPSDRLFFIGNSFTSTNDLPGTLAAMVKAWSASSAYVDSFTVGGSTLAEDVSLLQDGGSDAGLRPLVEAADGGSARWTDVMLQEQSEIPGFPLSNSERIQSMDAVVNLSALVVRAHAVPVIVMTWGYRSGDSANPSLYPDFLTMEGLLDTGFRQMQHAVTVAGYPVRAAPVGPAFQAVYESDVAAGRVPTASTSTFFSLYESDGKHPAPPGTYLMALVLMSTLYDVDPTTVCANPESLPSGVQSTLAEAARTAVLAERAYVGGGDAGNFDAGEGGLLCGPCPSCGGIAPACCGPIAPCPP